VIAGVAKRLVYSGKRFEIHNFARCSERAVFREELDEFRGVAQVHHNIGLSEEALENAVSLAISPTHATSQIICCGPPSFMERVERHAREWVYAPNVHRIVLGEKAIAN
jgi:ferredoxin-NADP reductase